MSKPLERRALPRWTVVKNQSELGFATQTGNRDGENRLVNISRGGALFVFDETPPLHEPIWVRMESPVKTDWLAAVPVRVGPLREVAVSFREPCPDDFLLAAMLGIDLGPTIMGCDRPQSWDDVTM
jgi:PilZ domain